MYMHKRAKFRPAGVKGHPTAISIAFRTPYKRKSKKSDYSELTLLIAIAIPVGLVLESIVK